MAGKAIWTGSISFGLVNVPVRLYSAVEQKDIRFHEFDERSGKRVRHKRVTEGGSREVDYEKIAKGYEVSDGKYVVLTKEELEAADPEKTRTIEIEDFVDLHEIDPIYFEKPYSVGPDKGSGAERAYALLVKAMTDTEKVGVARFVMRNKEYLVTLRPRDGVLILHTMYFPDEIRDAKQMVGGLPSARANPKDLQVARRLVEALSSPWRPSKYKDTHRKRVLSLIRRKQKGQEIVVEERAEHEEPADLMEALRASVEALEKRKRSSSGTSRRRKAS
jgi:DNA end-binding protein Ku